LLADVDSLLADLDADACGNGSGGDGGDGGDGGVGVNDGSGVDGGGAGGAGAANGFVTSICDDCCASDRDAFIGEGRC